MKCDMLADHPQTGDLVRELPVMETFYSIQGEGFHQGRAAHFIRLGGCDVGCHWCDVKESWDPEAHPIHRVDDLVAKIDPQTSDIVVVTGGEPLMHNLFYLCNRLNDYNLKRHLETSGAHPHSGDWDWLCLSPKKFKAPLPEVCAKADELKVVIYHPSDFSWAESFLPSVGPHCKLYLQPEWSRRKQVEPLILDYIKSHPRWAISLQVHKYLGID